MNIGGVASSSQAQGEFQVKVSEKQEDQEEKVVKEILGSALDTVDSQSSREAHGTGTRVNVEA